jgi:hypothetical protein
MRRRYLDGILYSRNDDPDNSYIPLCQATNELRKTLLLLLKNKHIELIVGFTNVALQVDIAMKLVVAKDPEASKKFKLLKDGELVDLED